MKRLNDTSGNSRHAHLFTDPIMDRDLNLIRELTTDIFDHQLSQRTITKRAYRAYLDHLNRMIQKAQEEGDRRELHDELSLLYRTAGKDHGPLFDTTMSILERTMPTFKGSRAGLSMLQIPTDAETVKPNRVMPLLRIPEAAEVGLSATTEEVEVIPDGE